jgi:hypothetical protein
MKPANSGSRRKKIILYYIIAVVLPGIILGYMAYRGIRNDQALREKDTRKKLEIDNYAFFAAIDSSFVKFIDEQASDSMLSRSKKYDPSLLVLFFKDTNDSKKLITHQLLYLPSELITKQPAQLNQPIRLERGLRL